MKKAVILSLIFTIYTIHVQAQSIYHNSLGNSVSPSFTIVKAFEDNLAIGSGVVLSLNSSVDLGISYNWYQQFWEGGYDSNQNGEGISAYASFLLSSELRNKPFGIELALLYSNAIFRGPNVKNDAFGIGINLSKKISGTNQVYSIPQIGFTFVPVSQNKLRDYNGRIVINQSKLLNIAWGFAIENRLFTLIVEPTYSYEFDENIRSVAFAFLIQI